MAAATHDFSQGSNTELSGAMGGRCFVIENTIDFSKTAYNLASTLTSATVINIPAQTLVLGVEAVINTKEATGNTMSIGDASSAVLYMGAASTASTGTLWSDHSTGDGRVLVLAATKLYTAANDIRVVPAAAGTTCLLAANITFRALCVKLGA